MTDEKTDKKGKLERDLDKERSASAAKVIAEDSSGPEIFILSTGIRAIIRPVSSSLLDSISSNIVEPEIPMFMNEDKGRQEPNESDPNYLKELQAVTRSKGLAAVDAVVMFGVELVDDLPADGAWLENLQFMETLGHIDLNDYDLENKKTLEYLYKRFVCVTQDDIKEIMFLSTPSDAGTLQAVKKFRSSKA